MSGPAPPLPGGGVPFSHPSLGLSVFFLSFLHWARDWRALALTQVHHWSRLSDSREDGEALSSVHSTAHAAGKLIHNLLWPLHSVNEDGDVSWFDIPDGAGADPAFAHGGVNGYDDLPMREYLVELK